MFIGNVALINANFVKPKWRACHDIHGQNVCFLIDAHFGQPKRWQTTQTNTNQNIHLFNDGNNLRCAIAQENAKKKNARLTPIACMVAQNFKSFQIAYALKNEQTKINANIHTHWSHLDRKQMYVMNRTYQFVACHKETAGHTKRPVQIKLGTDTLQMANANWATIRRT